MKVFTTKQIAKIDAYTIENEPIKSIDLMERAASRIFDILDFNQYIDFRSLIYASRVYVICGPGNNGGDGLALSRYLADKYDIQLYVILFADEKKLSKDCKINWKRLKKVKRKNLKKIKTLNVDDIEINSSDIVIDALFGNGLNRPVDEPYKSLIKKINESGAYVISIDIPSGLMGEDNRNNDFEAIIKSDITLTLEFPKLSFFFPENEKFVKKFDIVPIDLHKGIIEQIKTPYYYIDKEHVKNILKKRRKFAEKRDFGHALLVAGSFDKAGAAILSAKACLSSGVGLIHAHVPNKCVFPIQAALPEVMLSIDENENYISKVTLESHYTAAAIGPGIGTGDQTAQAFYELLIQIKKSDIPLLIDADGLNILSKNKEWLDSLHEKTILTPHNREFDRLFGVHNNHYERFLTATECSQKYNITIILKGAYTQIHLPDGRVLFNSSGTPALAKAGTGDVLTGMILSFLAQGYLIEHAAILGVYLHGLAGEKAEDVRSEYSVLASDVIDNISKAFLELYETYIDIYNR